MVGSFWKIFRGWKFWAVVVLLLPVVLLLVGNVVMSTGFGTRFVEEQVERKLGLGCEIGRVGWTPWGGGVVREVALMMPEGEGELVVVDRVDVDVSWRSLFQGKKRFERVEVSGVEMEVTVEELKELLKTNAGEAKMVREEPVKEEPVAVEVRPKVENQGGEVEKVAEAEVEKGPVVVRKKEEVRVDPVEDFEGVVVVRDVNVRISSEEVKDVSFEVTGFEAEVPVWGREREGFLVIGGVRVASDGFVDHLEIPLRWRDGGVEVDEPSLKVLGVNLALQGKLRMVRGLPYGFQVTVPPQRVDFSPFASHRPPVELGSFSMTGALQGYALNPGVVFGSGEAEVRNLEVKDPKDGSVTRFEKGNVAVGLNGAGLFAREFRLVGEEEAVLGNGFVSRGGVGAATVRVVVSPGRAEMLENRMRVVDEGWSFGFVNAWPGDRLMRDFHVELGGGGSWVDLGMGGEPVGLGAVLSKVRQEMGNQRKVGVR